MDHKIQEQSSNNTDSNDHHQPEIKKSIVPAMSSIKLQNVSHTKCGELPKLCKNTLKIMHFHATMCMTFPKTYLAKTSGGGGGDNRDLCLTFHFSHS